MSETVSIVIPCYNYGRYLAEAVESALAQTRPADEILIIDDGSTDDSLAVAQRYAATDPRVRVVAQPNQGAVAACNNGFRAAKGELILRLDADDRLHPRYLELTVPLLVASPEAGYAYTAYAYFDAEQRRFPALPYSVPLLARRPYILGTTLLRRAAFEAAGGYSQELAGAYEDWDLYLTLAERGWHGVPIPRILYYYRQHGGSRNSLTVARWLTLMKLLYRRHRSLHRAPEMLYLASAVANRSVRRLLGAAA